MLNKSENMHVSSDGQDVEFKRAAFIFHGMVGS
jgi:hypothetical protein